MEVGFLTLLLALLFLYWLTPLVLTIIGLIKWRSKPQAAKNYLIIAAIMLVIGAAVCGVLLN